MSPHRRPPVRPRGPTARRSRGPHPRGGKGGVEPPVVIRAREARAWELACRGLSQRQIAREVGLSQPAVSKLLRRVARAVFTEASNDLPAQKGHQLGRLAKIYHAALCGWEHSQGDATTKRQRRTETQGDPGHGTGRPTTTTAELAVHPRSGDPRFLDEARKAMADFRDLLGLNAPKAVSVHPGRPLDAWTDEELDAALAEQEALARPAVQRPRRPPSPRRRRATS